MSQRSPEPLASPTIDHFAQASHHRPYVRRKQNVLADEPLAEPNASSAMETETPSNEERIADADVKPKRVAPGNDRGNGVRGFDVLLKWTGSRTPVHRMVLTASGAYQACSETSPTMH